MSLHETTPGVKDRLGDSCADPIGLHAVNQARYHAGTQDTTRSATAQSHTMGDYTCYTPLFLAVCWLLHQT